ncbi:MAG: GAF domain-containing sensor histidine kinase [Methanobacterium sp.]
MVESDKWTEELLLENNERFELLSNAASALLSSANPENVVSSICNKAMQYLNCDVFFNYLLDKNQILHLNAYAGVPKEVAKSIEWLDLGVAVCGCVGRDGCRIIAKDIQNTPDVRTELVKSFGVQAYACHPIVSKGKTIGTLSFGTKSRSSFSDDELKTMKTITDYVATAMERKLAEEQIKNLLEETQQLNKELKISNSELKSSNKDLIQKEIELVRINRAYKALSNNSKAIINAKNESEYLDAVCKIIINDCNYPMVWIGYVEEDENKSVTPVAFSGFEKGYLKTLNISWDDNERGQGPTGTAIRTGKPCICKNMRTDPRFKPWREEALKRGYSSSIGFPLMDKDKVLGALAIYSEEQNPFSDEEVNLLTQLANDITYGLNSIRVYNAKIEAEKALRAAKDNLELKVQKRTSKLKEINEELKRSNEELQSFAYITSHDLQEPLRTIASYAQLLNRRYKGQMDSDADEFIDYMVAGATRMKQQIQGLLDYSRVGTRGGDLWKFNIENALNYALFNLNASIESYNAEITYDTLPDITADENQITQVFQNLIGNALKFRKDGIKPRIHISSKKEKNEYIFSIQDNGIGIENQYASQIFQVFKRLHTIGEYEGAGIGLAIVKKIIERHNGCIWVESEYGKGSTFYFTLPV